mgnify:CR=1 FL=1
MSTPRAYPRCGQAWAEFQEYYNIPEGVDASLYPCETEPDASSENPAEFSHPRQAPLAPVAQTGPCCGDCCGRRIWAGWSRPKRRGSMCLVRLDAGLMRYSISCRQQMKITRPQVPMRVKTRLSIPICGRHLLLWRSMRVWPRRGSRML